MAHFMNYNGAINVHIILLRRENIIVHRNGEETTQQINGLEPKMKWKKFVEMIQKKCARKII